MAIYDLEKTQTISQSFLNSLYAYPDGNRFRTCIQCGTCSGVCPFGYCMEYTPRKIIAALRMNEFEEILQSDKNWMCVSCYACSQTCPQQIPIASVLMRRLKEELLLSGTIPDELQDAMENSQRYGNPMGKSPRKRADWAKGLNVPVLSQTRQPVDVLWYVGDYASYHPAAQKSTRAMARLFNALGVDFGILGHEEVSDGDSQRMAGEHGLFEMLAEKNNHAFRKYEFNQIITTDPHALNAIQCEYPKLGIVHPVKHYTQYLAERIDEIQPKLVNQVEAIVAFHDPCYLGRVNEIYAEPRLLLNAIPGVRLIEMAHAFETSLCCGGGGGGMWLDGYQWDIAQARTSEWRIQEVVSASPIEDFIRVFEANQTKRRKKAELPLPSQRILAVACPYEKPRFEDAIKVVPKAKGVVIRDVAELLAQSMGI